MRTKNDGPPLRPGSKRAFEESVSDLFLPQESVILKDFIARGLVDHIKRDELRTRRHARKLSIATDCYLSRMVPAGDRFLASFGIFKNRCMVGVEP